MSKPYAVASLIGAPADYCRAAPEAPSAKTVPMVPASQSDYRAPVRLDTFTVRKHSSFIPCAACGGNVYDALIAYDAACAGFICLPCRDGKAT